MRLYQRDTLWSRVKGWLPAAGGLLIAALFLGAVWNASDSVEEEQLRMAEESIRRAAVSCYAAEGSYPQNVEYLTEHYGVQLDTRKYVVNYTVMGSNTLPYIEVVPKGGRSRLDIGFE